MRWPTCCCSAGEDGRAMSQWRLAAEIDDIRQPLLAERDRSAMCAIATLVEISGPAPRDIGAQMLITEDHHWGFLSGGCIEADVAAHGRAAMADGAPRLLRYGEGSPWIDIKLACGSGILVLVEPLATSDPAVATLLSGYAERTAVLWSSDGRVRDARHGGDAPDRAWDGSRFARLFEPALRLVIIGEDASALASAGLARQMGLDVVLVTPNGLEAAPFDGIGYHRSAPADALDAIGLDRWTAVAVMSHDREDDEQGLAYALKSDAFYVGAIGARARLEMRRDKLRGHGVGETAIARLHAPIGLQGFGKAPRDIALSLVADVAREFHARSAVSRSAGESMSSIAPISSVGR
ncbi:MAG: XdhC family protein [Blastomonas fulva]|uniref:XdhC family protein n=1 Tax=Blastomonas fulva TaxID=1550728 RepID=UPI0024E1A928|nr:XdhC family protein [Blastomonas fulva]MDK2755943.1 XdhC family protein [Blastomonas fulva]